MVSKMLFNYEGCDRCKLHQESKKNVLLDVLPVDICCKVSEYFGCSRCERMKENENNFLQTFEGMLKRNELIVGVPRLKNLTNAERQIFFFKHYKKAPITFTGFKEVDEKEMKQEIDKMFDVHKCKKEFADANLRMMRQAIKSYMKKNINLVCQLVLRCHNAEKLKDYINYQCRIEHREEGRTHYKFRNQYFLIQEMIDNFVLEYVEQLIGDDLVYCDKDGLNEWSVEAMMVMMIS